MGDDRTPASKPAPLSMWHTFLQCHVRLVESIEGDLLESCGIPISWFEVLVFLEDVPECRLRMQDLADKVMLSKSGLTRLVDRLEDAGLIERRSCSFDRRGTFAELTPKGRKVLSQARPLVVKAVEQRIAQHLTRNEQATLCDLLQRMLVANAS